MADQVYNLLSSKDCVPATKHIMDFVSSGGRFVNIISTFREWFPHFGNWDKRLINDLVNLYPNTKVEKLPRSLSIQTIFAAPALIQTAITIDKPIAQ